MVETPLVITTEITITPGKGVIAIITAILVTVGTPLITTAKTVVMLGTKLNQIDPSKGVGSTLSFKVRFYNDVIIIKELGDIDITVLNDKATMSETITLETL